MVIPSHIERKAPPLLAGLRRILQFVPGTILFNGVDVKGVPVPLSGLPYSVDVWYDPPQPHKSVSVDTEPCIRVPMALSAVSAGVPLIRVSVLQRNLMALVDSGASDDFIVSSR